MCFRFVIEVVSVSGDVVLRPSSGAGWDHYLSVCEEAGGQHRIVVTEQRSSNSLCIFSPQGQSPHTCQTHASTLHIKLKHYTSLYAFQYFDNGVLAV